jgi:Mn2+/Fe2+ NRAMP family transporter
MLIPKRYGYFVFGLIQSGLTSAVAAAIASAPLLGQGMFVTNWLKSWIIAWIIMTPFVLLAAPLINRAVAKLTREHD